jgi:single-stranded-DNA-specific exonuclease
MQWTVATGSPGEARRLAESLGVSETTARVLVRRGYADADAAQRFLDGSLPEHDPRLLGDVEAACETIRDAISAGTRICVHGDYDVDGICATALAVSSLRALGADVGWHLPSRFEEGYGLSGQTMSRLAEEGYGLIVTVDCGITAAEEVAEAKRLGLRVIVTDHHRPGDELPDCPIVATRPSEYPFPELCGTGVAYKLARALGAPGLDDQLDLVALATIADVVPLVDENRALAIAGLAQLKLARRPGIAALMRTARVDPATVDEGAVAFRLAPRINAAGRLCRPEAALELLLTDDRDEAARLAQRLEELNRDRQAVEDRILRSAVEQVDSWPPARQAQRGYVLADESWHEGVIGIVASRLVERYRRPIVLIAGSSAGSNVGGDWKGSGRSISSFDLHGALADCADHLQRFGGHRAAAGLSIRPDDVDAFAAAFAAHADAALTDDDLAPPLLVDAVVPGRACTLALADELRRLAPFGLGNPGVMLLVAGCELTDLQTVGEGKHLRFRAADEGGPAGGAIAFGMGTQLDRWRRPGTYDVAFRLEANTWNGTTAPQLVVRRIFESPERYRVLRAQFAAEWRAGPDHWRETERAVFEELGLEENGWRSLLESATFRALLEPEAEPALAEAA